MSCPAVFRALLRAVGGILLVATFHARAQADLVTFDDLGLRVARGFRVTQYADASLANDIYAMTLDARGDVVVTSRGYIRILLDTDGDGIADSSREFASTKTGGMGLCFDGNDLVFVGDGFLSRYRDANGDGVADAGAEQLLPMPFREHGGHAPRKGPDGWWYVIGGNDTGFDQRHMTIPATTVRAPDAGALLRVSLAPLKSEVIAHGFRNPYDFDFNWMGDIFTYDSDVERDYFLPWYTPTRIYHVAHGGHHGWRLPGGVRSWNRPEYYADSVSILADVGRGSPTGVTIYRHYQFPSRFRGGLFFADWTFGKILFLPLDESGTTYAGRPEVFLEPVGNHGFAPTDLAVAPDGSLYVSIGGRGTRGGVFRIEYAGAGGRANYQTNWMRGLSPVEAVLAAPQPMEAWSRAFWVPQAQRLRAMPFVEAMLNNRLPPGQRVRAVEVITELFNGLSSGNARAGASTDSPFVRARVAWSLGRLANRQFSSIISTLAADPSPLVRRCALEAILDRADDLRPATVLAAARLNIADPDKRIRQLAATLASGLPQDAYVAFLKDVVKAGPQERLTASLAAALRGPLPNPGIVDETLAIFKGATNSDVRLQALRLMALGLGDWNLTNASVEVYTGYENRRTNAAQWGPLVARVAATVAPLFPTGNRDVDVEASRVLAMVRAPQPELRSKLLARITASTSPTSDFHYLVVFSRLGSSAQTNLTARVANAVLSLDRKLGGRQQRIKQTWTTRLTEVVEQLVRNDPGLADAILRHPQFVKPAHVTFVKVLGPNRYLSGARMFASAAHRDPSFEWSGALVELLTALPIEEVRALLRKRWAEDLALRDDIAIKLAEKPESADREKFLIGLSSPNTKVVHACVHALLTLPQDPSDRGVLPVMRLLRRLLNEPTQAALRADVVQLLNHETDQALAVAEQGTSIDKLTRVYEPLFDRFRQKYPKLAPYLSEDGEPSTAQWALIFRSVLWNNGNPLRGQEIFQQRGCQTCHAGSTPLGPDLAGAAARFSPVDLMNAIVFPNRDVAPPYRTTVFQTRSGQHTGMVIFEAADGVIVQTGTTTTIRLSTDEILSRRLGTLSLMPSGLLDGLNTTQLADLYQYLKSLPTSMKP
jgi:putative membrane-bound dehydrogenase-like protein